jgi:hypothetical protein
VQADTHKRNGLSGTFADVKAGFGSHKETVSMPL